MQGRIDTTSVVFLTFSSEQSSKTIDRSIIASAHGIWDSGAQIWDTGAKIWDSGANIWDAGAVVLTTGRACRCLEKFKESLETQRRCNDL